MSAIGSIIGEIGAEAFRQVLSRGPEYQVPRDVEEIRDEIERWQRRLAALEEESISPDFRLIAFGIGAVLRMGLAIWLWA